VTASLLGAYLDRDALLLDVEAGNAADAIGLLAARLEASGRVRGTYRDAVIAREAIMPTGLPLGAINVAIPHTDVEHVIRPGVGLAVLRAPVQFASMDDPDERLDVRIVFALALTEKNAQIAMLQAIMELIQDEDALGRLAAARDPAQALAALGC